MKIREAGKHLLSLINDVLDLSKIEAGKMDVLIEDFEVADLIDQVQSVIEPLMAKNANALEVDCAPDLGTMRSDQTKLRQSLFNLLSNAAKFTERGRITLAARRHRPGRRRLAGVHGLGHRDRHDCGAARPAVPGVLPGRGVDLARLRRHRARPRHHQALLPDDGRRRRRREHARQGLDLHDHGAGHCARTCKAGGRESAAHPAAAPSRGTVLIIDDEKAAHELLARELAGAGYHILHAAGGREGLKLAKQARPDVITLDIIMPDLDGWSVLKALKADPELCDIPVVLVTIMRDRDLGFALGAADYITKPLDREVLMRVVGRHVRGDGSGAGAGRGRRPEDPRHAAAHAAEGRLDGG